MITGSFLFIWNMLCLYDYGPVLLTFWFQTDPRRENSASYLKMKAGKTDAFHFSHHSHALVTLHVQFLCYHWSKFDRWVHAENLCSILHLFTLPAEADRILCQLVMFLTVFFLDVLDVQNEIQRLSRVFCYSSLVCLLNFWCQSRKSDFGWHRFCFSPCWMRKRIIKAQVILALLDSLQQLHLEIWFMSLFRLR